MCCLLLMRAAHVFCRSCDSDGDGIVSDNELRTLVSVLKGQVIDSAVG